MTLRPFCAQLWEGAQPIYDKIVTHPFISGLTDGSLPIESFSYYLVQDAHYLRGYARALSLVAAHASDASDIALFAAHAAEAISVERSLHGEILGSLGMDIQTLERSAVQPATAAYVDHLIATCATGSYADGLAAVLPCYWIYAEVGQLLAEAGSPDPRYEKWIQVYGGADFGDIVEQVLTVVERVGAGLGEADRARAVELYRHGARHEWMFWDAAYRQLEWPAF